MTATLPRLLGVLTATVLTVLPAAAQTSPAELLQEGEVHLLMRTDLGDVHLAVDTLRAPVTGSNFLRYVDAHLFGGGTFYRSVRMDNQPNDEVKIEVIQGGMDRTRREDQFPPIPLESTDSTGILHTDGVLSMARSGPNSARAEFFITIGDQPSLDAGGARNADGLGFAAFGRVLEGMQVVHSIHARPTRGQNLLTRVGIQFIERVGRRSGG